MYKKERVRNCNPRDIFDIRFVPTLIIISGVSLAMSFTKLLSNPAIGMAIFYFGEIVGFIAVIIFLLNLLISPPQINNKK